MMISITSLYSPPGPPVTRGKLGCDTFPFNSLMQQTCGMMLDIGMTTMRG
ncbi:hypothetical protein HanRHA438_Chr10g0465921 [Helianthus annuus]|nr:hypothetical protein HanRHA438_Chr10g0465921 [Helianthus annuus]